jgi:ATP-dependent exoDNAse (exonuclease V) beta subunit
MNAERPLPITFPLYGTRLIEASAGTGKTFTLAALYLRLVLGHGDLSAFEYWTGQLYAPLYAHAQWHEPGEPA